VQHISKNTDSLGPASSIFVKGQLWQIKERVLKIGHVGRILVHHRMVDPLLKRASREDITSIKTLQKYLMTNHAVLVENSSQGKVREPATC
jgi:hypothetical protein